MTISLANARKFVEEAEIFQPVFKDGEQPKTDTLTGVFDAAKNQATVVGADVLSFVTGVTAEGREAIVNSSLLAQLVAKKKVPDSRNVEDWYKAYFDALATSAGSSSSRASRTTRRRLSISRPQGRSRAPHHAVRGGNDGVDHGNVRPDRVALDG